MRRKKARWKRILRDMRLNLAGLLILVVMASAGSLLLRTSLLRSAQSMGSALSRNYAAEESNKLSVFETLLSFGTASLDKQVEEGKKSVAFTLTYRDKDKTLTDEDVAKVHNKVLEALEHKLNAVLREM